MQKTKETVIYISVYTSSLTQLANKVARIIKPGEDIHNACSELACDIAKDNKLDWSNVLYDYYNYHTDTYPACLLTIPKKPKSRTLALQWWNELPNHIKLIHWRCYQQTTFTPSSSPHNLTGSEIEQIWLKETQLPYCEKITCNNPECKNGCKELKFKEKPNYQPIDRDEDRSAAWGFGTGKPNQKQFTQFSEELFLKYINKFSNEDKEKCFEILMKNLDIQKAELINDGINLDLVFVKF